jgi:hypothetical protein
VPAYDGVVRAGKRQVKEAREIGSGKLLIPADAYVVVTVTGGGGIWLSCRNGYEMQSNAASPPDAVICPDGLCSLPLIPEKDIITVRIHCVKER